MGQLRCVAWWHTHDRQAVSGQKPRNYEKQRQKGGKSCSYTWQHIIIQTRNITQEKTLLTCIPCSKFEIDVCIQPNNFLNLCFQPSRLPLLAARVPQPFHIHAKGKFGKKESKFVLILRFEPITHQLPSQVYNQFNQFIFVIIPIILGLHYHVSHSNISTKGCTNQNGIQLAYIGLEPKSF